MIKPYSALLDGATLTAEKPIVVLGWPEPGAANEFDTRWEALRFVQSTATREGPHHQIRVYEFVSNQWKHLPVSGA